MVSQAIRTALLAPSQPESQPWGELAGDAVMQIASERPLEEAEALHRTYPCVIHHAALADVLVSAIRKPGDPPWLVPPASKSWTSGCLMAPDGNSLRRVVMVSHWTDERKLAECRAWGTLGEQAQYGLPMSLVVLVIGQQRNGKRSSPWTTGFLHPQSKQLRFRKKSRSTSEVFNDRWEKIYREDHAEITRDKWLESMLRDDVLPEVCFRIDIPLPDPLHLQRIRETAERKLDALHATKKKPDLQLTGCDWPTPCAFLRCCHSNPEREPSEKYGYVSISAQNSVADPTKSDTAQAS